MSRYAHILKSLKQDKMILKNVRSYRQIFQIVLASRSSHFSSYRHPFQEILPSSYQLLNCGFLKQFVILRFCFSFLRVPYLKIIQTK